MKLKLELGKMIPTEVTQQGTDLIAGATGKTELANSPITLVTLQERVDNTQQMINAESLALDVLDSRRAARAAAVDSLKAGITQYANYALSVYEADEDGEAKLEAISLAVAPAPSPVGILPPPNALRSLPSGVQGSVYLGWQPSDKRPQYFLECAETADGPWTVVYTGRAARAVCSGLVSGKEYFFRVRAWTVAGYSGYSSATQFRAN